MKSVEIMFLLQLNLSRTCSKYHKITCKATLCTIITIGITENHLSLYGTVQSWYIESFLTRIIHYFIFDVLSHFQLYHGDQFQQWKKPEYRRETPFSPTMGKQLVNFTTCGCESSAPFFVIYKAGREPRSIGDRLV